MQSEVVRVLCDEAAVELSGAMSYGKYLAGGQEIVQHEGSVDSDSGPSRSDKQKAHSSHVSFTSHHQYNPGSE